MIRTADYIKEFSEVFPEENQLPWQIGPSLQLLLLKLLANLSQKSAEYRIQGNIAIHKTATVEEHVILKGPLIISNDCFVASHAYLRNGVYLGNGVSLGPGCEVKSSLIFSGTSLAHFNFAGDSLIGSGVNMEAGSVIANHFNERMEKDIEVIIAGQRVSTGTNKFGALIGDGTKIGANAVLSPGTILPSKSIIGRLELVKQYEP